MIVNIESASTGARGLDRPRACTSTTLDNVRRIADTYIHTTYIECQWRIQRGTQGARAPPQSHNSIALVKN